MRISFVSVALLAALSAPAMAKQLPGVRFDIMPVGCRITGTYGHGQVTVDEYLGRTGRNHLVATYDGNGAKTLIRTTTYDANGRMTRKDWAGRAWETFNPYSCFNEPGTCEYTYRNGDGAKSIYRGEVTGRGKSVVSAGGFVGETPFFNSVISLGPFRDQATYTDGSTTFRVTRYDACGLDG